MDYLQTKQINLDVMGLLRSKFNQNLVAIGLCCLILVTGVAHAGTTVTYYHNDLLGSPVAATDESGELIWRKSYKPFGEEIESTADLEEEFVGYTGHRLDKETGLIYAGARYYDPVVGRFMGFDPAGVREHVESNQQMFNRYAYGNNNPYIYVDPDGEIAFLIPIAIFLVKEIAAEGASRATNGATDFLSVRRLGTKLVKKGVGLYAKKNATKGGAETVQRGMSRAELKATQETGLLRGGSDGTHFVSDAVNSTSKRAQQRLALPQGTDVRVTMEVPKGAFSKPSKVKPAFGMPGGGMERTATGKIPVTIKRVDGM